jgi:hypoxanthine phosphoribosyltransferase
LNSEDKLKLFIGSSFIKKRVNQIAKELDNDYKNKAPVFLGILNGSFIFLSDLVRKLKINVQIDFLNISSYGQNKISSGNVRILHDFKCEIEGRDVIVVEDIVDSGSSIKYIKKYIERFNPGSVEFVTLLLKKRESNYKLNIKYIGFKIPDKFVVGYGLDYAEKYRNLKSIYFLNN